MPCQYSLISHVIKQYWFTKEPSAGLETEANIFVHITKLLACLSQNCCQQFTAVLKPQLTAQFILFKNIYVYINIRIYWSMFSFTTPFNS